MNPLSHASDNRELSQTGSNNILALWFLFNQLINASNCPILGVLNLPLIKETIFFKPATDETTITQALSLFLYLINPDSRISSSFFAKGSFFKPKVIQNLGL
jgi:hypothetical protein